MKENREPDSLALAALSFIELPEHRPLVSEVRFLESPFHQRFQVDFFFHDLTGRHDITPMKEITAPDFICFNAELVRGAAHVSLDGENSLRCAESAKCSIRIGIRHHNMALDTGVIASVWAPGMQRCSR